jgi:hypothetical protein
MTIVGRIGRVLDGAHRPNERERDKPRQGVVANTLKLFRNGAVGFIDWLDGQTRQSSVIVETAPESNL